MEEVKYSLMIYFDSFQVNKRLGKSFVLNWWGQDTLFMPPAFLEDLRKADFEILSFFQSLSDVRRASTQLFRLFPALLIPSSQAFHLSASVGNLYSTNTMIEAVKRRLNPQLRKETDRTEVEISFELTT